MNNIIYPSSLIELDNQFKNKVTCLLSIDNQLLVGLNNGALLLYRIFNAGTENQSEHTHSYCNKSGNVDNIYGVEGTRLGDNSDDPLNSPVTLTSLHSNHSHTAANSRSSSVPPSPSLKPASNKNNSSSNYSNRNSAARQQKKWFLDPKLKRLQLTKEVRLGNGTNNSNSINKPITGLNYLKDLDYLFVHHDSLIYIYIYSTFKFKKIISSSKGLTTFKTFSQLGDAELKSLYEEQKRKHSRKLTDNSNGGGGAATGNDFDEEDVQDKLQKIDSYSLYQNFYEHDPFYDSNSSIELKNIDIEDDLVHSHLVYAVRRKLYVHSWMLNDLESEVEKEITLSDRIKNIEFLSSSKVVVGLNSDFVIVDLSTARVTPLIIPNSRHSSFIGSPFSTISLGGYKHTINLVRITKQNTLISRDSVSVKINHKGELLNKSTLNWSVPPEQILFLFPYLILVNSNGLEIRDLKNGYLLQSIAISGVSKITVDNFRNVVYIYDNNNKILQCNMRSYIYQLNKLEQENKLSEAINLTFQLSEQQLPDKVSRLRQLQIKKAEHLFKENKFHESMILFSNFLAPPSLVLSLFPKFITGKRITHNDGELFHDIEDFSSLANLKHSDLILPQRRNSSSVSPSPSRPSTPTPPSLNQTKTAEAKLTSSSFSSSDVTKPTTITSTKYQHQHQHQYTQTEGSIYSYSSPKESASPARYAARQYSSATQAASQNRKKLMKALHSLLPYLADTRRKISKMLSFEEEKQARKNIDLATRVNNNSQEADNFSSKLYWKTLPIPKDIFGDLNEAAELVDTTLFNCYMITSPGLIGPLVRIRNHCNVKIIEKNLAERHLYKELVDFYYGKGLHEKALKLLWKLGKGEEIDIDTLEGHTRENAIIGDLGEDDIDEENSILNDSEYDIAVIFNNGINNHINAMNALKGPLHTVHYLTKLSQPDIHLIFEYIKWPMEVEPEKAMVVFLADSDESESLNKTQIVEFLSSNFDRKYTIIYLEHVIDDLQDKTPKLHTKYIDLLVESLQEEDSEQEGVSLYDKLVAFLGSTNVYEPRKTLRILLTYESKDKKFLYLKTFIFRRLKDHDKVLQILVYELQDFVKASNFCSELYLQDKALGAKYLQKLLGIYLNPDPALASTSGFTQNLKAALELLAAQGSRMSPVDVLQTLPKDLPLQNVSLFLSTQLKLMESNLSQSRIKSSLSKVDLIKSQELLLKLKSQSIVVTDSRLCKHCSKRLGRSVLSVFPDGNVTHYGCAREYNQLFNHDARAN